MSALAVFLIAVGAGDLGRRVVSARWAAPVVAVSTIVGCLLIGALWHVGDLILLVVAAIAAVAWLLLCDRAERSGRHQALPLTVLGVAIVTLFLLSALGSDVAGLIAHWLTWVGLDASPNRMLMVLGVMLAQLATANAVVRLVLGSVGSVKPVGQPQASDQLKGGRLLGPMERLLIVGLGLAGQLTMASAVVAAKSIIRFPEISAKRDKNGTPERVGIDDVTEYFLVGSLASWTLAFAGLALVAAVH
ncbi:hypothetical protein [Mycobacterium antarcticum]|uniref:hypothetical protein n=1 Tax=Mycolicibacterium sp. TUM20984 TaxID=3023368 RepID=UPI0023874CBC|nr:hypothetical protein [Mycolicibacterium sp. TUM20984]GLP79250.1 hypothetical protein TUM20984_06700 [Mycolicibacterium sp. TUM20984]